MRLRAAALTVILIVCLSQLCRSYPQAGSGTTGSLVNQSAPSFNSIAAQSAHDYQVQQAEALAAARAKAMKAAYANAIAQSRWEEAVKKLTDARDNVLAQLDTECRNSLTEIVSKEKALESRFEQFSNEVSNSDAAALHQVELDNYRPTDPWRMVNGEISYAKGKQWVEFEGTILEVQATGILMHGHFGPPLEKNLGERDYFVVNFPHKVADGETITSDMRFNAYFSENTTLVITNNNRIDGGVHTVRGLEYGVVVTNPPPELTAKQTSLPLHISGSDPDYDKKFADFKHQLEDLQNAALQAKADYDKKCAAVRAECEEKIVQLREAFAKERKEAAEAKAKAIQDKVLKFNQEQADKGDPVGLLRMGERYRDGEGVPRDLAKARDYLERAAAAGSPSAADELKALPAENAGR